MNSGNPGALSSIRRRYEIARHAAGETADPSMKLNLLWKAHYESIVDIVEQKMSPDGVRLKGDAALNAVEAERRKRWAQDQDALAKRKTEDDKKDDGSNSSGLGFGGLLTGIGALSTSKRLAAAAKKKAKEDAKKKAKEESKKNGKKGATKAGGKAASRIPPKAYKGILSPKNVFRILKGGSMLIGGGIAVGAGAALVTTAAVAAISFILMEIFDYAGGYEYLEEKISQIDLSTLTPENATDVLMDAVGYGALKEEYTQPEQPEPPTQVSPVSAIKKYDFDAFGKPYVMTVDTAPIVAAEAAYQRAKDFFFEGEHSTPEAIEAAADAMRKARDERNRVAAEDYYAQKDTGQTASAPPTEYTNAIDPLKEALEAEAVKANDNVADAILSRQHPSADASIDELDAHIELAKERLRKAEAAIEELDVERTKVANRKEKVEEAKKQTFGGEGATYGTIDRSGITSPNTGMSGTIDRSGANDPNLKPIASYVQPTEASMGGGGSALSEPQLKPIPTPTGTGTFGGDQRYAQLAELIGGAEGGPQAYNALTYKLGINGGKTRAGGTADLVNMTFAEVRKFQRTMIRNGHASTAVGKYQIIHDTLITAQKNAGLSDSDMFSPANQDKLFVALADGRGVGRYLDNPTERNKEAMMIGLSKEWGAVKKNEVDGHWDGFNGNKSSIAASSTISSLNSTPQVITPPPASIPSQQPQQAAADIGGIPLASNSAGQSSGMQSSGGAGSTVVNDPPRSPRQTDHRLASIFAHDFSYSV